MVCEMVASRSQGIIYATSRRRPGLAGQRLDFVSQLPRSPLEMVGGDQSSGTPLRGVPLEGSGREAPFRYRFSDRT